MTNIDVNFDIVFLSFWDPFGIPFGLPVDAFGGLWSAQVDPETILEPFYHRIKNFSNNSTLFNSFDALASTSRPKMAQDHSKTAP